MNHQIFERKLRSWVCLGARLSQYRFNNLSAASAIYCRACWLENESLSLSRRSLFKSIEWASHSCTFFGTLGYRGKPVSDWLHGSDVNTDPCGLTFTCNFLAAMKKSRIGVQEEVSHVSRPLKKGCNRLQRASACRVWILIWDEARQPPEFKHINKGRKRN